MKTDMAMSVVALIVTAYIGLNGAYMAISPLRWSSARWTATGQYTYDEVARQLRSGKIWQWRLGGTLMALLAFVGGVLLASWIW